MYDEYKKEWKKEEGDLDRLRKDVADEVLNEEKFKKDRKKFRKDVRNIE